MISPAELKKIQKSVQDDLDRDIKACMPAIMQTIENELIRAVKDSPQAESCYICINSLVDPKINSGHAIFCFVTAICDALKQEGYYYKFNNDKTHIQISWK